MPKAPVPADLDEPAAAQLAVIATLREDGSSATAATRYPWEAGMVLVNMDSSRRRLALLRRDPCASITILGGDRWHRHVTLEGRGLTEPDPDRGDGPSRPSLHGRCAATAPAARQRPDRGSSPSTRGRAPRVGDHGWAVVPGAQAAGPSRRVRRLSCRSRLAEPSPAWRYTSSRGTSTGRVHCGR